MIRGFFFTGILLIRSIFTLSSNCLQFFRKTSLDYCMSTDHNDRYGHNDEGVFVITETSAVSFRQNLGEMLNQVQYRHDSVIINKDGKPVAALVDARLFDRIRRMQHRFDTLCNRIEAGFASVPETEGMAEIQAAIDLDRAKSVASAKKP
jgi:prevent-host-death family protein